MARSRRKTWQIQLFVNPWQGQVPRSVLVCQVKTCPRMCSDIYPLLQGLANNLCRRSCYRRDNQLYHVIWRFSVARGMLVMPHRHTMCPLTAGFLKINATFTQLHSKWVIFELVESIKSNVIRNVNIPLASLIFLAKMIVSHGLARTWAAIT